jgi:hypothetical protein
VGAALGGTRAHGERHYDWTVLTLDTAVKTDGLPAGWGHWLLVRRQINPPPGKDPELAFYRCAGPTATPVPELIRAAGARWAIEECLCATRRSVVFPVSREELGGRFLGLMAYLAPKG